MKDVLVLNSDMTLFGTTDWQTAVCMVERDRAEVLLDSDVKVHPRVYKPLIIRIINAIRHLWKKSVPWSKHNVHIRDKYTCQYCKTVLEKKQLTIDHVIPKDQGGKNSWENTVCSCFDCNNKKSNRTPSQAHMGLRKTPYKPTIMEFIMLKVKLDGLDSLLKELDYFS